MQEYDVKQAYLLDKDLKKEHVKILQEWVAKQAHLPKFSELEVARFLVSCNYNNEMAKITIDNYATIRTHFPEVFSNRNTKYIKESIETICIVRSPKRTPEGYHVALMCLMDTDPTKYNCAGYFKKMDMSISLWQATLGISTGQQIVIDAAGSTIGHFVRVEAMLFKKYAYFLQQALPVRLKGVHLINTNYIVEKVMAMIKPFVDNDLFSLIKLHRKIDTLFEYVPQECLPEEYGGSSGKLKDLHSQSCQDLYNNTDYFKSEEKQVVDESKRQGKPKNEGTIFGIEGTFKKLDID